MFNYNPIAAQPQPQADKLAAEKMALNTAAVKQTGTNIQNKLVQPMRDFPADSAFISDEARKAFEKRDAIKRREREQEEQQEDLNKKKKKKKKKVYNPYLKKYEEARDNE